MTPTPAPIRPVVARCLDCRYEWRSPLMADGLRALGACPRCNGKLEFTAPTPAPEKGDGPDDHRDPHTVLGLPRR